SADINDNRNVSGGGINTAQRVMDCGDAGHILLSHTVAETLQQLSQWRESVHDLGECEVKHGVQLRIFNLFSGKFGNANVPRRIQLSGNGKEAPDGNRMIDGFRSQARLQPGWIWIAAVGVL